MAKKKKITPEFEYRMLLQSTFNDLRQVPTTTVTIETTKQFASFRYELSVEEAISQKTLRYTILGLKAPRLSLPATGPAQFSREYDRLRGKYTITVEHLDGSTNTFVVQFGPSNIKVLASPPHPFIELIVS
jgi:hypothetical protein